MTIVVLLSVYLFVFFFGLFVWRSFYKRHILYRFQGMKDDRLFGLLGHRELGYIFLFHLMVILILSTLGILYVW